MTISEKEQHVSSDGPLAFAWETLPELAKSRWEEAVAYDVTMENQLARAKADRTQAEIQRQRIAREILEATKEVCEEILSDGKRALDSARRMEADAAKKLGDSQWELEEPQRERSDAEAYRDKVFAEVDQQIADIVDRGPAWTPAYAGVTVEFPTHCLRRSIYYPLGARGYWPRTSLRAALALWRSDAVNFPNRRRTSEVSSVARRDRTTAGCGRLASFQFSIL